MNLPATNLERRREGDPLRLNARGENHHEQTLSSNREMLDAEVNRILASRDLYHRDHPLSRKLEALFADLNRDPEIRLHIIKTRYEEGIEAFAVGRRDIFVSDGFLRKFSTEEEVNALLMHELHHIRAGHTQAKEVTPGKIRGFEFETNIHEMINLDELGKNSIGSIMVATRIQEMDQENQAKPGSRGPLDKDIVHGDPAFQIQYLRELKRFYDLRFLSRETTPFSADTLIAEGKENRYALAPHEIDYSSPREVWSSIRNVSLEQRREVIETLLQYAAPQMSPETAEKVVEYLYNVVVRGKGSDANFHMSPLGISELLQPQVMSRIGISFAHSELRRMARFLNLSPDDSDEEIIACRKAILEYAHANFGSQHDVSFELQINTSIALAICKREGIEEYFEQDKDSLWRPKKAIPSSLFDGKKLRNELDRLGVGPIEFMEFIDAIGIQTGLPTGSLTSSLFYIKDYGRPAEVFLLDEATHSILKPLLNDCFPLFPPIDLTKDAITPAVVRSFCGVSALYAWWADYLHSSEEDEFEGLGSDDRAGESTNSAAPSDDPLAVVVQEESRFRRDEAKFNLKASVNEIATSGCFASCEQDFRQLLNVISSVGPLKDLLFKLARQYRDDPILMRALASRLLNIFDTVHLNVKVETLQELSWDDDFYTQVELHERLATCRILLSVFASDRKSEAQKTLSNGLKNVEDAHNIDVLFRNNVQISSEVTQETEDQSEKDASKLERIQSRITKQYREAIDRRNRMDVDPFLITIDDEISVPQLAASKVRTALAAISSAPDENFFSVAIEQVGLLPGASLVAGRVAGHKEKWVQISEKALRVIGNRKIEELDPVEREGLLCVMSFSRSSLSSFNSNAKILRSIVSEMPFEEGFALLRKYEFLPMAVLQDSFDYLSEVGRRDIKEIRALSEWYLQKCQSDDAGTKLMQAEMASYAAAYSSEKERAALLVNAVTTNVSDAKLRQMMMRYQLNSVIAATTEDEVLKDVSQLAFAGESNDGTLDGRFGRAYYKAISAPSLKDGSPYTPPVFTDLYNGPFRQTGVFKYGFVGQLAIGRAVGLTPRQLNNAYDSGYSPSQFSTSIKRGSGGLFDNPKVREEMMLTILGHYTNTSKDQVTGNAGLATVMRSLCEIPSSEDLFYHVGPFIAGLCFQLPENPSSTREAALITARQHILSTKALQSLLVAQPDDAGKSKYSAPKPQAYNLVAARLFALSSGTWPKVELVDHDGVIGRRPSRLKVTLPEERSDDNLEKFVERHVLATVTDRKELLDRDISPMGLAIRLAEQCGSLGLRWLQFIALYRSHELDPKDRERIEKAFDRVKGQNRCMAVRVLDREAQYSPKMRAFMDNVKEIGEIIGGGSIYTVLKIIDKDDNEWAVAVKNPNADYATEEMKEFASSLLEFIKAERPDDKGIQLLTSLLNDACEWVKDEIRDPFFYENAIEFERQNTNSRTSSLRETLGHFCHVGGGDLRLEIPETLDSGTGWVRIDRFVPGENMSQLVVTDETNIELKTISRADAQAATALIVQNFLYQVLESGLFHSNITPGNCRVSTDRAVCYLDRKNLQRIEQHEQEALRALLIRLIGLSITKSEDSGVAIADTFERDRREGLKQLGALFAGDRESIFQDVVALFLPQHTQNSPAIIKLLTDKFAGRENASAEEILSESLAELEHNGFPVDRKWKLLIQNILGLKRLCAWAEFRDLSDAVTFVVDPKVEVMDLLETILPETVRTAKMSLTVSDKARLVIGALYDRARSRIRQNA